MLETFNEFVDTVREYDMTYFIENVGKLKVWINKLKDLNTIQSTAECKKMYYTLLELLETIEDKQENMEMNIQEIQRNFFDHVEIVREMLK